MLNLWYYIRVAQNFPSIIYESFPHSMSVLGHSTLEKLEDQTSRVNIHIAMATLIIQRIFHIYKEKICVSAFLNFKIEFQSFKQN
jgi:hypothetical protein